MGVHSGAVGMVNGMTTVRNWQAGITAALSPYYASNTKGAGGHNAGNRDWSGSWDCYGHTPAYMPGETVSFVGSESGTKGVTGSAIVDSVTINWDIAGAKEINHTVNFSGNGAATVGAAVASIDTGTPDIFSCYNLAAVQLGDDSSTGGDFAALANVKTAALTLTAANASTINSSSGGWTLRAAGNFTATLSITVDIDDISTLPAVNDAKAVRLYVDDTDYWEILWMRFGALSNIVVDKETNAIVGATLNANLVIICEDDGTTVGSITTPGAVSAWWPAA